MSTGVVLAPISLTPADVDVTMGRLPQSILAGSLPSGYLGVIVENRIVLETATV
jgi:hypothetical protein